MSGYAWQDLRVVEADRSDTPCDCCGKTTTEVDGDLEFGEDWQASYFVYFSNAHPETPPLFRVITGNWAEETPADELWVFEANYLPGREGFALRDAGKDHGSVKATWLNREDIVRTAFAEVAFAMLDAILLKDSRLEHMRR